MRNTPKNVLNRLEKVEKVRKRYESCTLNELIWLQCDLESSQKFSDDTSTSFTGLFASYTVPLLTFLATIVSMFVALITGQAKVFTGDDKQKSLALMSEVANFLADSSTYFVWVLIALLIIALSSSLFLKYQAKNNHLRLLVIKELINQRTELIETSRTDIPSQKKDAN